MDTIDLGKDHLPQVPPGASVPDVSAGVAPRTPPRRDAFPVLVVEDDEAIRETLAMLLDDAGFAIRAVGSGAEALELLRASPVPLVVLLDLIMPEPDGRSVLRMVAADPRLARRHAFILVTAAAEALVDEAQEEVERSHADLLLDTVRKPFDIDAVVAAVERAERRLRPASGTRVVPLRGTAADARR